jgi:CO/xanthine dehydrogenase Mo-binding subunit
MTASPEINRRSFLASAAAIGGGLSLGFRLPFGVAAAEAADSTPEVNAWVVIRPDDTVVIRIARSEMGQGTLTGSPSWSPRSLSATGPRSPPNIRPPAETPCASGSGGISRPAAAAASASRTNMSARAARRRATC